MSPIVKNSVWFSIAVLTIATFLNARVALERASYHLPNRAHRGVALPSANTLSSLFLNHLPMAADVAWVFAVVDHGEASRDGFTSPNLKSNAYVVAHTDPGFIDVYAWFSAASLIYGGDVAPEKIEEVNDFLREGMVNHPEDYQLPYAAALNYLGYSANLGRDDRLKQVSEAIRLLEIAALRSGADESVPLLLSWFYSRKRQLTGETQSNDDSKQAEIAFNLRLLSTSANPQVRSVARENLTLLGASETLVVQTIHNRQRRLDKQRLIDKPYLDLDLWATLVGSSP